MDKWMKILKSNIWLNVLEMTNLHSFFLRIQNIYLFHFISSWSFPLYKFWTLCWMKLSKSNSIKLKPSSVDFWISLYLGTSNYSIAWKTPEFFAVGSLLEGVQFFFFFLNSLWFHESALNNLITILNFIPPCRWSHPYII